MPNLLGSHKPFVAARGLELFERHVAARFNFGDGNDFVPKSDDGVHGCRAFGWRVVYARAGCFGNNAPGLDLQLGRDAPAFG